MRGTLSGRSPYIFQATLQLTLSRNLWRLRFHAGKRQGHLVQSDSKGYGFISQNEGFDVFVHHRNISGEGFRTLEEGQ
jgi:hypothetical protein